GILGTAFVFAIVVAAGVFFAIPFDLSTKDINAHTITPLSSQPMRRDIEVTFINHGISTNMGGIYIRRDSVEARHRESHLSEFIGDVIVANEDAFANLAFDFQPVKSLGGTWFTSREYAVHNGISTVEANGHANWFEISNVSVDRRELTWHLPINAPAAKYGIRARVVEREAMTGNYLPVLNEYGNYRDYFFVILYSYEFNYIRIFDDRDSLVHNVARHGNNVRVNIRPNAGATSFVHLHEDTSDRDPFIGGRIEIMPDVFFDGAPNVTVVITNNGRAVPWLTPVWSDSGFNINLPANMQQGMFHMTIRHRENNAIIGTYLIDNSVSIPVNTMLNVGIAVLVIGLVGFLLGFFFVMGPQIVYFVNAARIKRIDNKVYGKDGASIRKEAAAKAEQEKLMKEGKIEKQVDDSRSFKTKLENFRNKRSEARRLGLSIDEYAEVERRQGANISVDQFGMGEARRMMGEGIRITDQFTGGEATVIKEEKPEFDLVESIRKEYLTQQGHQFANLSDDARDEATKPIEQSEVGIIGRLNKFLEDKKD
ncbi:MAG: hypothetical protein FWC00_05630, partial [Firmicutes bacterium]|nr:hypothetical protein [Bacillota bacterium]